MEQVIIILQAITIFTSTAFIIINFIWGIKEARRQSVISVISCARKERWQSLLNAASDIGDSVTVITAGDMLDAASRQAAYIKLSAAVSSLSYTLNSVYNIDVDIIANAKEVLRCAKEVCMNEKQDTSELNALYAKLYREISIYSHVEWTRIKEQAKGKNAELEDWDTQYTAASKNIKEQSEV